MCSDEIIAAGIIFRHLRYILTASVGVRCQVRSVDHEFTFIVGKVWRPRHSTSQEIPLVSNSRRLSFALFYDIRSALRRLFRIECPAGAKSLISHYQCISPSLYAVSLFTNHFLYLIRLYNYFVTFLITLLNSCHCLSVTYVAFELRTWRVRCTTTTNAQSMIWFSSELWRMSTISRLKYIVTVVCCLQRSDQTTG